MLLLACDYNNFTISRPFSGFVFFGRTVFKYRILLIYNYLIKQSMLSERYVTVVTVAFMRGTSFAKFDITI